MRLIGTLERLAEDLIRVDGLSFMHGERLIYDNIQSDHSARQNYRLHGADRIGKNTLLRLIGGLKSNQIVVIFCLMDGYVPALSRSELYHLRKRIEHAVPTVLTGMNVFDNVAYPRVNTCVCLNRCCVPWLMKLETVGLRGAAGLMPAELSGGMAPPAWPWHARLRSIRAHRTIGRWSVRTPSPWRCWSS